MINRRPRHELQEKDVALDAEAQTVNSERIALLVRQHSGSPFTAEDQARLDGLTARMLQLVPSVTEKDWEILRDIERRSAETEGHLREIRKKYGLGETG
jgi:hypothetical protein